MSDHKLVRPQINRKCLDPCAQVFEGLDPFVCDCLRLCLRMRKWFAEPMRSPSDLEARREEVGGQSFLKSFARITTFQRVVRSDWRCPWDPCPKSVYGSEALNWTIGEGTFCCELKSLTFRGFPFVHEADRDVAEFAWEASVELSCWQSF